MLKIPHQVVEEGKSYRTKVEELQKGLIEPQRFLPYRVSMGVYEQRDNDTYMVRSRIPSGVVNLEQLEKISELAKKYSRGYVHLTTRQGIQFHKVDLEDTATIMEELLEVGIVTKGTGGNTARGVGCSPLSGVSTDEVFDVTPYAMATTEYALNTPTIFNLPRKYKIAFSNSPADTGNATIADLGFVAKTQDGQQGFEVYGAGGFGGSPNVSIKLAEFIPATEVLYHVQAMKELFENEGDRTNKHKARIRYILQRLGEEGFKAKYEELLLKVKTERNIEVSAMGQKSAKAAGEPVEINNPLVVEQKQLGYYSVYVHPENGNLNVENLDQVLGFVKSLEYEVSIRLTNTQGFFVRDLKGTDAEKLLEIILAFTSTYDIDNSVACAGASTCKLGLCLSQNLLSAIKARFAEVEETVKIQLPRVFISGCPNSCGQHQKGAIGLFGRAKRVADGLVPMYSVLFGGAVGVGKAVLGKEYGAIPTKKIPEFLYQLALLKQQSEIADFDAFLKQENNAIVRLIDVFSEIESEGENPDLYYDFGSQEKFSLKGRGPGECSAGVLDVIKLDISNAKAHLAEYQSKKDSNKLYDAGLSASRALLILRGVDTTKDRLIFKEFITHFVDSGYVKKEIKQVIDSLVDYKLGDLDSLENYSGDIEHLINKVVALFESLNPKLEITLPKDKDSQVKSVEVAKENENSSNVIDLKGVKCPMNFVKAKIELAKIKSQETIVFKLDNGDPIKNVPKSIQAEGHEVISIDDSYEGYSLLVVKKK